MRRFTTCVLLMVAIACAHAAPTYTTSSATVRCVGSGRTGWGYAPVQDIRTYPTRTPQTQCIMTGGATYSSTIYQPFNNAAPSEYVDGKAPQQTSNGPRRVLGGGGGPEWGEGPCPVGEPWILAAFALLFGGVLAWKRKNKGKVKGASRV